VAFAKDSIGFVASPDHPLMSDPQLNMAGFAEDALLVRERGSGSRTTVERAVQRSWLAAAHRLGDVQQQSLKQICGAGFAPA